MKAESLKDLFLHELHDLYDAERQLVDALPKMVDMAADAELADALREHWEETKDQVVRLEDIFNIMGVKASTETCHGIRGIIKEAEYVLGDRVMDDVRDAAIIAAADRVEHYEIAGYGFLCDYANLLGLDEVKELLKKTLREEQKAAETLERLAKGINGRAAKEVE